MTKAELRTQLEAGCVLEDLFVLSTGQECTIYKAEQYSPGEEIIYIPDLELNGIPYYRALTDEGEIQAVVDCCYCGDDFLAEAYNDPKKARMLFSYCDWQHPSSAAPEVLDDDEE